MDPEVLGDVTRLSVRSLVRPIRPWSDLAAFLSLYQLCKKWRFDVVHTHNSKDGILARWAAHLSGVPAIVHTIHNLPFRASRVGIVNRFYALLERVTARITNAFLGVSEENVREYLAHDIGQKSQFRVVYSGLEFDNYRIDISKAQARERLGLASTTTIVGWFGRLNYQKDPITFIRAARVVADHLPGISFVVCGDDPLGENLGREVIQLVRSLNLSKQTHFLGFRSDLPVVLKAVDCVMHSSRYEGMGRTVCESLLCDRAVAGTNVDGVREVIRSGERGGYLVPPEDPAALADATLKLLQDPARTRSLAASGRAWVEENLSAAQMVRDIADVYEELLDAPRARLALPRPRI
jgi:glycosyltransferase involved in cell wall biosynthesis